MKKDLSCLDGLEQEKIDHSSQPEAKTFEIITCSPVTISRRAFLQITGPLAFLLPFYDNRASTVIFEEDSEEATGAVIFDKPPSPLQVIRVEDFLLFELLFQDNFNLSAGAGQAAELRLADQSKGALLIIEFPPQHIVEEVFSGPPLTLARNRISGKSRVAFKIPTALFPIPYKLENILEVLRDSRVELGLASVALPRSSSKPNPIPAITFPQHVTALELPYRLFLSPIGNTILNHAVDFLKVTHKVNDIDRTELWHTHFVPKSSNTGGSDNGDRIELRAIWSPEYNATASSPDNPPFRSPLESRRRRQLVEGTSDFSGSSPDNIGAISRTITSDRLILSSLGAWLDAQYDNSNQDASLAQWVQETVMGRDQFVWVTGRGVLYPYGHRASFIEIAQREIEPKDINRPSELVAYMKGRKYIIVQDQEKLFPDMMLPHDGRQFPYRTIKINIDRTPDITQGQIRTLDKQLVFSPQVDGRDYLFPLTAIDRDGNSVNLNQSLIFIDVQYLKDASALSQIQNSYRTDVPTGLSLRAAVPINNQKVAFVPSLPIGADSKEKNTATTLHTTSMEFDADFPFISGSLPLNFPFQPKVTKAKISIPSLKQIVGDTTEVPVEYAKVYLEKGFNHPDNIQGEVFLELSNSLNLDFSRNVKNAAGLATPSMNIVALSRKFGPVGGVTNTAADSIKDFAKGVFDPKKYFSDDAKLLGVIKLKDLLKPISIGDGKEVPQIVTKVIYGEDSLPAAIEARLHWEKAIENSQDVPLFIARGNTKLRLDSVVRKSLNSNQEPVQEVICTLSNFALSLIKGFEEFITVDFTEMVYKTKTGEKNKISIQGCQVTFDQKLNFLQELGKLFNPGGQGPSIELSTQRLLAKYSFPIPSVTLGAFSLTNLSLSIGVELPFDGRALSLALGISDRMNPFLITVGIFGGGGYFAMSVSPNGLISFEAAIEFGGAAALDILGIASGRVYVMVGISYATKLLGDGRRTAEVTGYLRCGGELRVLGIITVSVVFYMSLTYDIPSKTFYGRATCTIRIKIAFFSKSVDLSIERSFSAAVRVERQGYEIASTDPRSLSLPPAPENPFGIESFMDQQDWNDYCAAFA